MDMIGGPKSYWLGGAFGDGKGEPSQSNSVSHGCPPARFRNVNIVNTGREELMHEIPLRRRRGFSDARAGEGACAIACSRSRRPTRRASTSRAGWSGNTRFAGNEITTSGGTTNTTVTITSTIGKRRASATTNVLDDESLKRTVAFAESLAKLSPEDPEIMPELGPAELFDRQRLLRHDGEPRSRARARPRRSRRSVLPSRAGGAGSNLFVAGYLVGNAGATADRDEPRALRVSSHERRRPIGDGTHAGRHGVGLGERRRRAIGPRFDPAALGRTAAQKGG